MKKWWWLVAAAVVIFCAREWWMVREQPVQIFGEKNVVLVRTPGGNLFGIGDTGSARASAVQRAVVSFFDRREIRNVRELPVGQVWNFRSAQVQRISPGVTRVIAGERVVLLIDENFSEKNDRELIVRAGVNLNSDWWAMTRVRVPTFLPSPEEGVVFASGRSPSKKMKNWAREQDLSIVTVRETGGARLDFSTGSWRLRTRK